MESFPASDPPAFTGASREPFENVGTQNRYSAAEQIASEIVAVEQPWTWTNVESEKRRRP